MKPNGWSAFEPGTGYIAGLDGLRAVSIALVMIAHAGWERIVPGGLGVTVFFFVSGFLITTLLTAEHDRTGRVAVGAFYGRRFLRLAPELYGMIVLTALAGPLYGQHATVRDVAAGAGYATNYLYAFGGEGSLRWSQLWSLAVEEHFYLTFPALFVLLRRRPRALLAVLVAVCGAALAWRVAAHGLGFPSAYTYAATECRLDSIAWGCAAAIAFGLYGGRWARRPRAAAGAGAAGLTLLLASVVVRDAAFRDTARYTLQGVGLLGVFAALFLTEAGARLRRGALEWTPLRELGRRSYGAYLWHFELLLMIAAAGWAPWRMPAVPHVLMTLVLFPAAWGVAWTSERAFLRPARALRRRLGSRPLSSPPLGLAEAGGGA